MNSTNTQTNGDEVLETIPTRSSLYTRRGDGIIVQTPIEGTVHSLADARENVATYTKLANGQKRLLLVDGRPQFRPEPGVREYYAGPQAARYTMALALLVGSVGMRMMTNLFLSINKPLFPTRSFSTMQDAVAWLHRMERTERMK